VGHPLRSLALAVVASGCASTVSVASDGGDAARPVDVLALIDALAGGRDAPPDRRLPPDTGRTPTPLSRCPVASSLAPAAPEPTVVSMSLTSTECAVYRDGTARSRGLNLAGEVGAGLQEIDVEHPTEVVGLRNVRRMDTGGLGSPTIALLTDGTVRVWGGDYGADGLGTPDIPEMCGTVRCARTPIVLPALDEVEAIVNSPVIHCALRRDHTLWCWGVSPLARPPSDLPVPALVDDRGDIVDLIGAQLIPMFRRRDGTVIPDDEWTYRGTVFPSEWTPAPGLGNHLCALVPDGTVRCWGPNTDGQVGDGTWHDSPPSLEPVDPGLDCVRSVTRGGHNTCAVRTDGTVWCWGMKYAEELGIPHAESETCGRPSDARPCVTRPRRVEGIDHVDAVFPGYSRTCALRNDRTVWCWGTSYGRPSAHSAVPRRSDW
jgi:alpha-tubulin suppressor-like RCC1 family protein